jgi:hypothetical protein
MLSALGGGSASVRAAETPVSAHWQTFASAKDRAPVDVLTDYSYAGYAHGERGIPELSGPIFRVTDFGAVPNDLNSDEQAIRKAVSEAEKAGGGVVVFPAGKFLVWTDRTHVESIRISSSRIVLRGAGSSLGGTVIRAIHSGYGVGPYPVPKTGADFAAIPYVFAFEPSREAKPVDASAGVAPAAQIKPSAKLTDSVKRASFVLPVDSTEGFIAGDWIALKAKSKAFNTDLLAGLEPDVTWTRIFEGIEISEYHQIREIREKRLVLCEPTLVAVPSDIGARVDRLAMMEQVGVEDIAFEGAWRADFVHHRNALDDEGWDAIVFDGVAHGWVRRCAFLNLNSGIYLKRSSACSLLLNRFSGTEGHYNAAVRSDSSFNLSGLSFDTAGSLHGVSSGNRSSGTAVWRWTLAQNQSVDSHGNGPYATLMDRVDGGTFTKSGGPAPSFPNHLNWLVFWNFSYDATDDSPVNLWEVARGNAKFVKPLFVGLHGKPVNLTPGALGGNEFPGRAVAPESLYEAQLQLRLNTLPAWVTDARREWETLRRQKLPAHGSPRANDPGLYPESFKLADLLRDLEGMMNKQELGWAAAVRITPVPDDVVITRDYVLLRTVLHQLCTYASPRGVKDPATGTWITTESGRVNIQVTVGNRAAVIVIPLISSATEQEKNQAALGVATDLALACEATVRVEPSALRLTVRL